MKITPPPNVFDLVAAQEIRNRMGARMSRCRELYGCTRFAWLWAVLWAATFAWADPVPMSAGGQPTLIGSESVAILEETLSIEVRLHEMRVEAGLLLESQVETPNFAIGFPCSTREDPQMTGLSCKTKPSSGWTVSPKS